MCETCQHEVYGEKLLELETEEGVVAMGFVEEGCEKRFEEEDDYGEFEDLVFVGD